MEALASAAGILADRPQPPCHQSRLSIVVLADGPLQPRWMVESFARIARSDYAVLTLLALSEPAAPKPPGAALWQALWQALWKTLWKTLWQAYCRTDAWAFAVTPQTTRLADIRSVGHQRYRGIPHGESRRQLQAAMATGERFDVAFLLGDLDAADFAGIARFGVWNYAFGGEDPASEALSGWREVIDGRPLTEAGLRVRLPSGTSRWLTRSWSRTYPLSVARNRANLLNKTALFAERELRRLQRAGTLGTALPETAAAAIPPAPSPAARSRVPAAAELLRGLATIGTRILRRGLQKLCAADHWFIAYRFGSAGWNGDSAAFTRLQPPADRLWADPFPLYRDGRYFVFFEEVRSAGGKGHICAIELDRSGASSEPVKVLEQDHHLSYPFLIERQNELFMVPEAGQSQSIDLYRCIRFPDLWRFEKSLLQGFRWADATFHHDGARWWMFVIIGAPATELFDELHLFHAHDLLGDWQAHPANPVKSDVRGSRPAGRLFMHQGSLCRPAQICTPLYGSGVAIARIKRLTPECYEEQEFEQIFPASGQNVLGIHTLNRAGDLTIVDGWQRRRRLGPVRSSRLDLRVQYVQRPPMFAPHPEECPA